MILACIFLNEIRNNSVQLFLGSLFFMSSVFRIMFLSL